MLVLNKIGQKFQSEDRKRLLENFLSLSVLQGANYILPLITLPYLVRVLGPEKFGLIAFAQSFIQYFNILTDYGFNLSATREISIHRDNKEKISEIFSSVMITKFGLMIISLLILSGLVFTIPKFRNDWLVYFFTFGIIFGNVLFPIWFFQGMERMKYITILNIVAKGIFTICIFIFIRKMEDYLYVPLINSIGFLVAGGLSLRIVSKNFGIKFILPSFKAIKHQLKEGWHIFISTVAISLYTTSNTFILGLFTNNTIVGYYAAAEKIVKAVQGLWTPVSQTIYPYFSKLYNKNQEKAKKLLVRMVGIAAMVTFLISALGCLSAPFLVPLILGKEYLLSIRVFQILIFVVFAVGVNNILGIQGLVSFGYGNKFSQVVIIAGILHLILLFIFIPIFNYLGPAIATVSSESFICIIEYIILRRLKIL